MRTIHPGHNSRIQGSDCEVRSLVLLLAANSASTETGRIHPGMAFSGSCKEQSRIVEHSGEPEPETPKLHHDSIAMKAGLLLVPSLTPKNDGSWGESCFGDDCRRPLARPVKPRFDNQCRGINP